MYRLSDYISEAVSHGHRHAYHDDMTLDGICEWLRSLGFKKAGFSQSLSFNKEYDIYVEDNGEYILVRALFKMNGKNYQLDTKVDLTSVGDVKSMELYVVKRSNTYLIGAAYDKNMAAYDEIMDQVDSIKK